jgi:predicted O-linked N-acetylglucosamine transferase (SPINDLY family)
MMDCMATISEALAIALQHHQAGRLQAAEQIYRRILAAEPCHAESHNNLGVMFRERGMLDEAIACYRQALKSKPDLVDAHYNLGLTLRSQGKLDEAIACYRRALELSPDFVKAHNSLGVAFSTSGQLDEAIACYRRALELNPEYAEAHSNLGAAFSERGMLDEAVACYRRALGVQPASAETHVNLGSAFNELGNLDEAIACYRRALELKPDYPEAHSNLVFTLQYGAGITPAQVSRACDDFDRQHAAPLRSTWRPHANPRQPERPLRLGFVSADFRRHPVGYFYLRALECLREEDCQLVCYSATDREDDFTTRFRAAAHAWRAVGGFSDSALAEQIRADGVDILFDLASHAAANRLLVFARKPAPLQIAWAGPTGLSAMDYVLADAHLIPPGTEGDYREKPLRMPDAYACYEPPLESPPVTSLPALDRGYVTFGCLNNLAKITPQVTETWAQILRRLPASRLVIRYGDAASNASIHDRLRARFAGLAIPPDRIRLVGLAPYRRRLDLYGEIDLALDPFPFSGCTTTCEALWMGVPSVTCPGNTYLSRQSTSILRTVGLDEFVTQNVPDYVARAVALAEDLPRLAALRPGVRQRMAASPLCDGKRFAANMMGLLRDVWRDWCNAPRSA